MNKQKTFYVNLEHFVIFLMIGTNGYLFQNLSIFDTKNTNNKMDGLWSFVYFYIVKN